MAKRKKPDNPIPAFKPVPRAQDRHDGWTPERQRDFIEALAETGSVAAAARAVAMSVEGTYRLRRSPGAQSFNDAWRAALDHAVGRLEDMAFERALNGVEVAVWKNGEQVGTRIVHSERLMMFLLRTRCPARYTEPPRNQIVEGSDAWNRMREKWKIETDRTDSAAAERMRARLRKLRDTVMARVAAGLDPDTGLPVDAAQPTPWPPPQAPSDILPGLPGGPWP